MNILVVARKDADNLAIINVIVELRKRGHDITILEQFMDNNSIRMFKKLDLPVRPLSELNEKMLQAYDVCFSCQCSALMKQYSIYTFIYTFVIEDSFVADGADFLFTYRNINTPDIDYKCAKMEVGNTKNDTVIKADNKEKNRILFVDSGHIPFGHTGKRQIAETILNICYKFPDYEVCIKPRWLREKITCYTHKNTEHIYDVIEELCKGNIPDNLNMLNEHLDLQELIDSSVSVITLYSGAHLDVIQRNKGLIILSGWDNEDKFDMRNAGALKKQHDLYSESGCVVDYHDVLDYLPLGIKANEEYKKKMIPYEDGASKRIADVMEYTYENFIKEGKFPKRNEYTFENYKEEMEEDVNLSFEILQRERVYSVELDAGYWLKGCLAPTIDFSYYYNWLKSTKESYSLEIDNMREYSIEAKRRRDKLLIDKADQLMSNDINQSFLFKALYEGNQEYTIFTMDIEKIHCKGIYYYYLGMIYQNKGNMYKASKSFLAYLQDVYGRKYEKYIQDGIEYIKNAFNCIFNYYNGENLDARDFIQSYIGLYESGDELKVRYDRRCKAHSTLPRTAERLYEIDVNLAYKCMKLYADQVDLYKLKPINKKIAGLKSDYARVSNSLSNRIGLAVTWLPRKSRKIYREIKQVGIIPKIKEMVTRTQVYKIADKYNHLVMEGYKLYASIVEKYGVNMELLLSSAGTGDAYLYGMMFENYAKRKYPQRDAVFGAYGKAGAVVANLMGINDVQILSTEEFHLLYNLMMFYGGDLFVESMHYHVFYRHICILAYMEGLHNLISPHLARAYLGIESEDELKKPVFNADTKLIDDIMKEAGCKQGNTIVLSPYAHSVRLLPMSFWDSLANKFIKLGYDVCTNSIGDMEPPVSGTKPIYVPYDISVPFMEQTLAVVGVRSGFFDVINTADCLIISICMESNKKRSLVCHISDTFSLANTYGKPNQFDMIYTQEQEDDLINNIIELVIKRVNNLKLKEGGESYESGSIYSDKTQ